MSHRRACLFPPASPSFFRGAEVVSLSPSFHPLPQERGSPQTRTRAEALPAAGRPLPPPARPSAPLGRPPPDGATPHGRRGARAPGSPPLPAAWAALRRTAPRRGESDPAEKTGRAEDPASGRGWRYGKDGPVRQAKGAPRTAASPACSPSQPVPRIRGERDTSRGAAATTTRPLLRSPSSACNLCSKSSAGPSSKKGGGRGGGGGTVVTPTGEELTERPFSRRRTTCVHPLQRRCCSAPCSAGPLRLCSPSPPLRARCRNPWRWARRRGASSEARRGDGREGGSVRPEPLGAPKTAFPKEGRGPVRPFPAPSPARLDICGHRNICRIINVGKTSKII